MHDTALYREVLEITHPWRVDKVELHKDAGEVHVHVQWRPDTRFACPECGKDCPGYDTQTRRWRHLDTCQYRTILVAEVPRAQCPEHGVKQVSVPRSERNSRFTALFEAQVVGWLKEEASISAVSRRLGLDWSTTASIMERAVERGIARRDSVAPTRIGVDETSAKRGRNCVTVVRDVDRDVVLHVADGRGKEALASFYTSLPDEQREGIEHVVRDMHKPFISATNEHLADAKEKICFDKFHIASHLGDAIDKVRREENRELQAMGDETLKGTRYAWLWNPANTPAEKRHAFKPLSDSALRTARAWAIREEAMMLWHYVSPTWAAKAWQKWLGWTRRCRLEPVKKVGRIVKNHLYGVMNAVVSGFTNAGSEAMNTKIQHVKRIARGFRNPKRFRMAILFHCGGLDLYPDGTHA